MVFHKVPTWLQKLFPLRVWRKSEANQEIFLTFDDGPIPGVTDFVLSELDKRGMRATFFVVGDNVRKHLSLAKEILAAGHSLGNHTYNHLHGWKTNDQHYFRNIKKCDQILWDELGVQTKLFRPPYGVMKYGQAKMVLKEKEVVMWEVLSGDYDPGLSKERILKKTINHSRNGSIILFHDQEKTAKIIPQIIPDYLDFIQGENWKTALI